MTDADRGLIDARRPRALEAGGAGTAPLDTFAVFLARNAAKGKTYFAAELGVAGRREAQAVGEITAVAHTRHFVTAAGILTRLAVAFVVADAAALVPLAFLRFLALADPRAAKPVLAAALAADIDTAELVAFDLLFLALGVEGMAPPSLL